MDTHKKLLDLPFNPSFSQFLHIDINSCFATIEQQANPYLRGKPTVVASYNAPYGCTLAASKEAKLLGIKTGTRIFEAKKVYPNLIVIEPDSDKYRFVHKALKNLLLEYTPYVIPKSIDEFVLDLSQSHLKVIPFEIAKNIKERIFKEIGDWITVSIGIGPSRFLAKTAAGVKKPDGLEQINIKNFEYMYKNIPIGDLCGIGPKTTPKLKLYGLNSAWDLYTTPLLKLESIFRSVFAYYWYRKIRGWDISDISSYRKSIGNSYVLPACAVRPETVLPILAKLVDKTAYRMRKEGYATKGIGVHARLEDYSHWQEGHLLTNRLFATSDIYKIARDLLLSFAFHAPIRKIGVVCFDLVPFTQLQLSVLENIEQKKQVMDAMDIIKKRWGTYAISSARMISTQDYVPDRIAFGNVRS